MRRREFLGVLGGAAAVWPLAARAQQASCRPSGSWARPRLQLASQWVAAFVQRLHELGWIEGRTVASSTAGQRDAPNASPSSRPSSSGSRSMSLSRGKPTSHRSKAGDIGHPDRVRLVRDPLGTGLVASLSRPGGNVTGLSVQLTDTVSKRLELLRRLSRVSPVGGHGQCRRSRRRAGDGRG